MMRWLLTIVIAVMLDLSSAWAMNPDEVLSDPVLEARARTITREVRCLVCQGESVDESQAPLAADLRKLVRARLVAGDSDEDVRDYLVERYGDYVMLRPPLGGAAIVLWLLPFAVLIGAGYVVVRLRKRAGDAPDGGA